MTKKNLTIENVEPLLLFGSNDRYLKKVEAAFPKTKIIARGNRVVLEGSTEQIGAVERVIQELVAVLSKNQALTENDVESVLAIKSNGNGSIDKHSKKDYVILHTPSGNVVKAKTPNQKKTTKKFVVWEQVLISMRGKSAKASTMRKWRRKWIPLVVS